MTSTATLASYALLNRLKAAVPDSFYGRAALETTSTGLPVLTLWPIDDTPTTYDNGVSFTRYRYTRTLIAEVKVAAGLDWADRLDEVMAAIRQALYLQSGQTILEGHAVNLAVKEARYFPPADNGDTAYLQLNLAFDYIDRPL